MILWASFLLTEQDQMQPNRFGWIFSFKALRFKNVIQDVQGIVQIVLIQVVDIRLVIILSNLLRSGHGGVSLLSRLHQLYPVPMTHQ